MYIEELNEGGEVISTKEQFCDDLCRGEMVVSGSKRALVGVGARALFYPTLLYNVVRNKIQTEFRWWDRVDEFVLLGAVPFPADVPRLKALGVAGVITLNEPYETLVPTSLYLDHGIDHLVIPTRDYLFAPSDSDINCAVEFIHGNASCGKTTYVHCKAGRGRSTTIVLCYLVKHKHMTPEAAFDYVRSIRPRVLLASSQWQAVREYYLQVKKSERDVHIGDNLIKASDFPAQRDLDAFDDGSVVLVSKSDLDGYDETMESGLEDKQAMAVLNVACRVQFASQAAITRLSCLWLRCHSRQKIPTKKAGGSVTSNQLESVGIDIHVY